MYEQHHEQLVSRRRFFLRFARNFIVGLLAIAVALFVGMFGYRSFEHMSWIDAFANASMILSGMGPFGAMTTDGGKIFAGVYALFSGLFFFFVIAIIYGPMVHRFLHRFHVKTEDATIHHHKK
jgi:hypothetical protein